MHSRVSVPIIHKALEIMTLGIIDAEECFSQIVNSLRELPGLPGPSTETEGTAPPVMSKKFIEQYMMGEIRRE
jgi:hypothetical protein